MIEPSKKLTVLSLFTLLILFSGCVPDDTEMPVIVGQARHSIPTPTKSTLLLPLPPLSTEFSYSQIPTYSQFPAEWVPPVNLEKNWEAIIIHHSATDTGNVDTFDKWHRNKKHWSGIGYDFVIGNGRGDTDGSVEITYRWQQQITGAHCGGTKDNWANRDAVGICLVGNFNEAGPSQYQMNSLSELIRFLQQRYNIPADQIYGHRDTPDARPTDCPGKKFPMYRLKSML